MGTSQNVKHQVMLLPFISHPPTVDAGDPAEPDIYATTIIHRHLVFKVIKDVYHQPSDPWLMLDTHGWAGLLFASVSERTTMDHTNPASTNMYTYIHTYTHTHTFYYHNSQFFGFWYMRSCRT